MRKLRNTALTGTVGTLAAASLILASGPAGADPLDVTGDASGLTVAVEVPVVGPVNVGPLPVANTPPGESRQVLGVAVPDVVNAEVLTASSQPTGDGVTSQAQVVGADVLAAPVSADVITATCSSNAGGSTGNSSLANADVLGNPVSVTPPANTQVPLPLLGTLFLNEQVKSDAPGSTSMTVNAVRLALDQGLIGGEILISHAACVASGPEVLPGSAEAGPGGGAGGPGVRRSRRPAVPAARRLGPPRVGGDGHSHPYGLTIRTTTTRGAPERAEEQWEARVASPRLPATLHRRGLPFRARRAATRASPATRLLGGVGVVAVVALVVGLFVAFSGGSDDQRPKLATEPDPNATTAAPAPTTLPPFTSTIATANVPEVQVFDAPEAPAPSRTYENPWHVNDDPSEPTVPLVFLTEERRDDGWTRVLLPERPNGATGWVRNADFTFAPTQYHISSRSARTRSRCTTAKRSSSRSRSPSASRRRRRRRAGTTSASCSRRPIPGASTARSPTACRPIPTS